MSQTVVDEIRIRILVSEAAVDIGVSVEGTLMAYLIAKYALTSILATIAGFVFGRWMTRRKFVDVTEAYEGVRIPSNNSDAAQWERLWSRLDSIPEPKETNLTGVNERLDALAYAVTNLPVRPAVNPNIRGVDMRPPVDSASIDDRLRAIEAALTESSTSGKSPAGRIAISNLSKSDWTPSEDELVATNGLVRPIDFTANRTQPSKRRRCGSARKRGVGGPGRLIVNDCYRPAGYPFYFLYSGFEIKQHLHNNDWSNGV